MATPRVVKKLPRFKIFLISPPCDATGNNCALALLTSGPASLPPRLANQFQTIDTQVAAAKEQLDQFDTEQFTPISRALDVYADLRGYITTKRGGQIVTNAWLKMYEMVGQLGLIEACQSPLGEVRDTHAVCRENRARPSRYTLRAFCNAELPGAFVSALNHYICTRHPDTQFEWVASSLFPGPKADPSVLGDAYGLYQRNRDNWLMDAKMSGDISDINCVRELALRAKAQGAIDLYTSDVGVDVSADFNRQEEVTARLNLGQILTGLLSLRVGGAFVVKTYTFTHSFSLSLLSVCAAFFDTFHVTKPKTSRPTNSEVYLVGVGFKGISPDEADLLAEALYDFDFTRPLIPLNRPGVQDTLNSLLVATKEIHQKQQIDFLLELVTFTKAYKNKPYELKRGIKTCAAAARQSWLDANAINISDCKLRISKKQ